ncbi:monovalent cation/H+ antiporter complex subunit F [Saxibacter everestensis]|uniref:Monovalent cation/H+ antiporter complex subunit F n=1 Tax=Saxibacter everestensis TaxID=2909229 RepID=A0ABY8QUT0_9MICO|nr:monovalent cation/H+ antiporter complex subunit F [Brevibacteriaceae bacterium ZFBP1038]
MFLTVAMYTVGICVAATAAMAVIRIVRGPSILDRMIASDVLLATIICGLAADMIHREHTYNVPVILVLAIMGMVGSISVARYVSKQDPQ